MKVLIVYARMYASCLGRAAQGLKKNTWTALLPMGLAIVFGVLAGLLSNLGLIGGFLISFVLAAVGSAYLYFVGEIVGRAKVRLSEFRTALQAYFWSVINLMFVLWIVDIVLGILLRGNPNQGVVDLLFGLACFVLLNPAPEIIYQVGTYGGLATVQSSIQFIQESWIEWFLPMIPVGVGYYYWGRVVLAGELALGLPGVLAVSLLGGALLHYVMLFRGFLFQELKGSSHRQRMFKYRNATARD